jgi:hypothetical protein
MQPDRHFFALNEVDTDLVVVQVVDEACFHWLSDFKVL